MSQWTIDNGLTLHSTQAKIFDSRTESVVFLGDEFRGLHPWSRKKSFQRLKDAAREIPAARASTR